MEEVKIIGENLIKLYWNIYGFAPCKLNSICELKSGKDYRYLNKGNIPVYASGGVIAYVDSFLYDKPTIILHTKGSIQNIFYVDFPFWCVSSSFYLIPNKNVVRLKYLYYYLQNIHLEKFSVSATVPGIKKTEIEKLIINLPPVNKQDEIISQLDAYNKLLNNNDKKETNLKIQYEEYRNKLLIFKRKSNE